MRTRDLHDPYEQELKRLRARVAELENQLHGRPTAAQEQTRVEAQEETPQAGLGVREDTSDRFRKALSIETAGVLFFSLHGRITDANEAFERMSGYTREELRNIKHWEQLTAREFVAASMRTAENLATTGRTPPYEKQMIRKDGSTWWGLFAPMRLSGEGWDSECMEFIIDITPRKKAEEELRLAEARLRATIESMVDEVWIVDAQGRVILVNGPVTENLGIQASRWPDINAALAALETFYPDGTPRAPEQAPLPRCLRGEVLRGELEMARNLRTGELRWREVSGAPLRGPDGIIGAVIVARDVTERKRTEDALRASEASLKRTQEIAHLGSWELDVMADRLTWSEEVYHIFGLHPQEFGATYEAFLDCVHPDDRAAVDGAYSGSVREGRESYEIDHRIVRKDTGEIRYVHEKCQHVRDAQGRIVLSQGMVQDITERKNAEDALRESEERYRTLFTSMGEGFALGEPVLDRDGKPVDFRFLEFNAAFERESGLGREAIGRPMREVLPRLEQAWIDTYYGVAITGKPVRFEQYNADTARHYSVFAYSPSPGRFATVFRDVTETKRLEQALRENEERLSLAIASTGLGTFDYNPQTGKLIWDEAAKRHFGLSAGAKVDYETFLRGIHHDDRERVDKTIKEVLSPTSGGEYAAEYRTVGLEDHKERWLSAWGRVLFDSAGNAARFLGVTLDISERKRTEDALRESEARERARAAELQIIMDAVPVAVMSTHDAEGRYITGNRMAYDLMRMPYGSNISKSALDPQRPPYRVLKDGRELELHELPVQRAAAGDAVHNFEFEIAFADGTSRDLLGEALPIFDDSGNPRGAVGVFVDITERKRDEERLRQTQKLESIGLLAGGIAHDFNNLLTGIIGNASLLLEERAEENRERRVQDIIRTAERAATLANQLLAYSGKGQFIVKDIDVSEAVHDLAELVQFSIPKSVEVDISLRRRLPLVEIDPSRLQQIIMNLVINAGEAIGEGNPGTVTLSTSRVRFEKAFVDVLGQQVEPGTYVCISVRDTGPGIDADKLPKIFDPFFTTKFTGRGLGLAAVSGIVRSQKGAVMVESGPGRGTTFRVYLPVHEAAAQAAAEEQPLTRDAATVLVADDNAEVRNVISAALRRNGYRVLTAADGQEALAIADREPGPIAAAVLDVVMPIMGAEQVLPALTAKRPDIKILLTSGYSETGARRLLMAYRGSAFIQKPYTVQQILKAVEDLCGRP